MFSLLIFVERSKNTPNPTMMIPPTWLNPSINSPDDVDKMLFMITPNVENITENPKTKNIEFKIMLDLLIEIVFEPSFWFNSDSVVPEIYAKNAGIIGNMHGAANDPSPASAAIPNVISSTH